MSSPYRFLLAFHLISVFAWMAGILYLWRLYVYFVEATDTNVKQTLLLMQKRLYQIITAPAMTLSFILGCAMLAYNPNLFHYHWMQLKLFLALLMIGITHMAKAVHRRLEAGETKYSSKTLRILNEVPTLLMIGIVLLVILQPF